MSWANYHSHTYYCDGSDHPEAYIKNAIELGFAAYGFSGHAPIAFNTEWCIPDNKFGTYLSDIKLLKQKYARQIEIYLGLEIDYIPNVAGRKKHLLKDVDLDYFIGSIHFVNSFYDKTPWNIDTSFELFLKGLKEIFKNDFKNAAIRFFELSRQMIVEEKPDIIGHLDKIKMFNSLGAFFSETEKWYIDQVDLTLKEIKDKNTIVEINTRGYYKYNQSELYPSEWILKRAKKLDIPLTINSDSHKPDELDLGFQYATEKLKKLKISELTALIRGNWQRCNYNSNGLIL